MTAKVEMQKVAQQSQVDPKAYSPEPDDVGINGLILNQKCIIRTYSAGVWYGEIIQKQGSEVIVKQAKRLWRWRTKKSFSLSALALYGINHECSEIAPSVPIIWLEAIELTPCTDESINSIESAPDD